MLRAASSSRAGFTWEMMARYVDLTSRWRSYAACTCGSVYCLILPRRPPGTGFLGGAGARILPTALLRPLPLPRPRPPPLPLVGVALTAGDARYWSSCLSASLMFARRARGASDRRGMSGGCFV